MFKYLTGLFLLMMPFSLSGKVALIFGITGQDGSYLTELLLDKGYEVHGVKRRSSSLNTKRLDCFYNNAALRDKTFFLHYGDITDSLNVAKLIHEIQPDEIYNLAAQSHVRVSFDLPEYTAEVDGLGTLRILEAIRFLGLQSQVRFYQASTSEMFGKVQEVPQSETTSFYPRSPYGVAKVYGYWITVNYREAYGLFACNGILFNHESPNRGETFLTKKVCGAAVKIAAGQLDTLYLGNLEARRDWGHARDYVEAMWLMLQQDTPEDFVIGSGETHSVREFVELSFKEVGIEIEWKGEGLDEVGLNKATGQVVVAINSRYFRPTEVDLLLSDPTKAKEKLGWEIKCDFPNLIKVMVEAEKNALGVKIPHQ